MAPDTPNAGGPAKRITLHEYTMRMAQRKAGVIPRTTTTATDAGSRFTDERIQTAKEERTETVQETPASAEDGIESRTVLDENGPSDAIDMDWEQSQDESNPKSAHNCAPPESHTMAAPNSVPFARQVFSMPTQLDYNEATENPTTAHEEGIRSSIVKSSLSSRPGNNRPEPAEEGSENTWMGFSASYTPTGSPAPHSPDQPASYAPELTYEAPLVRFTTPPPPPPPLPRPHPQRQPQRRPAGYYQQVENALRHLDVVQWKPQYPGILPTTDEEYTYWINSIAVALLDTTLARDNAQHPTTFAKFGPSGYTDDDYNSTATSVVYQAVRLYEHGATSLFLKLPSNRPRPQDADLDFKQRMETFMRLVKDFKRAADDVMCGRLHEEMLTAPIAAWHALKEQLVEWNRTQIERRMQAKIAQRTTLEEQARIHNMRRLPMRPAAAAPAYNPQRRQNTVGADVRALYSPTYSHMVPNYPPGHHPTAIGQNMYPPNPPTYGHRDMAFKAPNNPGIVPHAYEPGVVQTIRNGQGRAAVGRTAPRVPPTGMIGPLPVPQRVQAGIHPPLPFRPTNIRGGPSPGQQTFGQRTHLANQGALIDLTQDETDPAQMLRNMFG